MSWYFFELWQLVGGPFGWHRHPSHPPELMTAAQAERTFQTMIEDARWWTTEGAWFARMLRHDGRAWQTVRAEWL